MGHIHPRGLFKQDAQIVMLLPFVNVGNSGRFGID